MSTLIQVNRKRMATHEAEMTGAQLCALAGVSTTDVDVWRIQPLGYPDDRIKPDDVVPMFHGLRIFTAPKVI
jgi:hypothetical protein